MAEKGEYKFEMAAFHPTTLPMRRLREYIDPLLELFGYENNLHLIRVDEGSAVPCILADPHVITQIERRFVAVRGGGGPKKAHRAIDSINELLAEDNTSAILRSPFHGVLIEFPGVLANVDPRVGPIQQVSEVQGEIVQIGGRDETISVHVRDGKEPHILTTSRERGRELAKYLFQHVRFSGPAKWVRQPNGKWRLITLEIESFYPLENRGLRSVVDDLRAMIPKDTNPDFYTESLSEEDN